jgi:putative restriction endonuclease
MSNDADMALRLAAFQHLKVLMDVKPYLTSDDLSSGFQLNGERVPLVNPQRGIFKPKAAKYLLSIRTVFPVPGRRVWYDDQREVHSQIYKGSELVDYSFMGSDPNAADNRWLREAWEARIPIIYFLGIAPRRYQPIVPTFVADWQSSALKALLTFAPPEAGVLTAPETPAERRYALRQVKQRLHQASFREAVIAAYDGRCALSGLPEAMLLDAAHIVPDTDEKLGQPVVQNGLPLSKIHHAAFDAHLIGIDPDYRIHVSQRLLDTRDGPMLEALKALHGGRMRDPLRPRDLPERDRLAIRFERFKLAA